MLFQLKTNVEIGLKLLFFETCFFAYVGNLDFLQKDLKIIDKNEKS